MKPLLGYNKPWNLEEIPYPVIASPKLDGIRCLAQGGLPMTRSLKLVPNKYVKELFYESREILRGLDGELLVGEVNHPDVCRITRSGVMAHEGQPDFKFVIFDKWDDPTLPFVLRLEHLQTILPRLPSWATILSQTKIMNAHDLNNYHEDCVRMGFEGIVVRSPVSLYKHGRSTLKEMALLKLKNLNDFEAEVIEVIEAVRNDNEAELNELGNTKRSSSKAGRTEGKGYMGRLTCRRLSDGVEFGVGTFRGLTEDDKREIWNNQESYKGAIAKIQSMAHGEFEAPREPRWIGWRDRRDM